MRIRSAINRREFLRTAGAGAIFMPVAASGAYQCGPPMPPVGARQCFAEVSVEHQAANYDTQWQSQWCWAASISMLFRFHGYRVSQVRIVQETFGSLVNMPASSGAVISRNLNRPWIDDDGRRFQSQLVGAFDLQFGVSTMDNAFIVTSLAQDKPLVIGSGSHAMLLIRADYIAGGTQPIVMGATALDPWPTRGRRALSPQEIVPANMGGSLIYLAAVQVSSA